MIVKILAFISTCVFVYAQNLELPVSADYSSIQVKSIHHEFRIQESSGAKVVLIGIKDKGQWSFRKDSSGAMVIEQKDYEDKLFASGFEGPKEKIILKVPAVPLLVTGTELDLSLEGIKNTTKIILFKGIIKGFKTHGEMRIFLNSGEILWDSHFAPMFVNGSQVKMGMKNSNTDLKLITYSGNVNLEKNTGHSSITSFQGNVSLQQTTGSSQIELSRGAIQMAQSQGRHDIVVDEVNVDLKATKESDYSVKLKNGKLNYSSAGVGSVWLNLKSKEADIFLPTPLKPQKVKNEVFYKGRTLGEKSAARLEVISVNAPIIIR